MSRDAPFSLLIRRPLVGVFFVFAAGCGWAAHCALSVLFLLILMGSALLLYGRYRSRGTGWVSLYVAVACAGAVHVSLSRAIWLEDAPAFDGPEFCVFQGKIRADPVFFDKKGRPQTALALRGQFEGRGRAQVRVVFPGHWSDTFRYGERWRFSGRFYPYRRRGRHAGVLYVKSVTKDAHRVETARLGLRLCAQLRDRGQGLLGRGLDDFPRARGLLQAMILGQRAEVRGALRQQFVDSGTLHLFALSGLHVGIVALLLIALLKLAGVTRPYWGLILIPVLWGYVVMTGMRPSTLRAFIMAAVYWGGPLVRRRPDAPLAWALAGLVVLVLDPLQVGDPGFVLSFAVVGVLMIACGRFRDWLIPEDYENKGKSLRRNLQFYGRSLLLSSTVAWAASFPLALFYFQRGSLIGPFANLLAVPLSFVIVLTGGITLVVGGAVPLAAELLNHANRLFLDGLCGVAACCASVPFGHMRADSVSVWQVLGWYAGLAFLLAGKQKSHRRVGAMMLLALAGGFWVG